jgi:hypothetical protein
MTHTADPTSVFNSDDREWILIPIIPQGEAWIKVIHADEELRNVIFKFRFSPDCELRPIRTTATRSPGGTDAVATKGR